MSRRIVGTSWVGLMVAFAAVGPLTAQSTGPSHAGFDPNASTEGHVHIGEIGEKYLALEKSLKCNCSCGLDVHMCQYRMSCGVSPGWSRRIRESLEAGAGVEEIQAGFVADYGGTVLMAPPAEGFNLVGYLLPGIAIVTAGMLLGLLARNGTRRTELVPIEQPTDAQSARLQEALKKLDETESPDW